MSFYIAVDSVEGPFASVAEAEFFAQEKLKLLKRGNPKWGNKRTVHVLEHVLTVKDTK